MCLPQALEKLPQDLEKLMEKVQAGAGLPRAPLLPTHRGGTEDQPQLELKQSSGLESKTGCVSPLIPKALAESSCG